MKIVYDQEIPYLNPFFGAQNELIALPADKINSKSIQKADALFVRSVTKVNPALLNSSTVHFVGTPTAGMDHIDHEYLESHHIPWAYAPGCNANAVSDYVLLSIACLQEAGLLKHSKGRAGVIGAGHVGQQVINTLNKLSFDVIINDPLRAQNEVDFISTPLDQFYDLDIICLHTPLVTTGPHPTYHLLDTEFLSHFNPQGILLNAGRGACINTEALKKTKITTILDVWENEPNVDFELVQSAFIATTHIAGYSQAAKYRATKQIFDAFCNHFEIDNYRLPEEDPSEYINIRQSDPDWTKKALEVENLMGLTGALQNALLKNPKNISVAFKKLRQQYKFRREIILSI